MEEVTTGEMMGPTQGVGEAMAITQGTIMPKLQTITEVVVVVAATTEETTTEEGAGVVMATETAMVATTTTRTVNSSKAMVAAEVVSGMILHHIRARAEVEVVAADMEAVVVAEVATT